MVEVAELVIVNGMVRTMDPAMPIAQAVAVAGNRIVAVGATEEIRGLVGPWTRVVDAAGKLVLPGFHDAHVHFLMGGFALLSVDLRDACSPEELARRLGDYARGLPEGSWILDGHWDHEKWPGSPLPTRAMVDAATPKHPVLVCRSDEHMSLANSLALRLAGITRDTQDPPGGLIVRDAVTGEPTGLLKDAAADLVTRVIPEKSIEEKRSAALVATEHAARLGVTSVADMSGGRDLRLYEQMVARGELKTRIYAAHSIVSVETLCETGVLPAQPTGWKPVPHESDMLRSRLMKGFADGSLGSSTALFFEPYSDEPTTRGLLFDQMLPEGVMLERVLVADRAGLQVTIHAIGDEANLRILDIYEQVAARNGPRDRRFRIEHAQHLRPSEIVRFARQGTIASMQPYHVADDGRWCDKRIGAERSKGAYPFRSLLDSGARLAFGSDWPVATLDPLAGIKAAVTRQTLDGKHPEGWVPEQRIGVDEAVRAFTVGSAYAEFAESSKGTIAVGKLADLVVLDRDIYEIAPAEIDAVRVVMTVADGRVVYETKRC